MPCLSPNSGEIKRKCRQAEQKNEKDSLLVSNEILKKTNILLVKNGTKKKKATSFFHCNKMPQDQRSPQNHRYHNFPSTQTTKWSFPMISELNFCKWNQTDQVTADPSLHFKPSALLNHIKGLSLCNYEDTIAKLLLSSGPSDIMPVWFRKERVPSVLR